jgi:hypothetical protein
VRPASSRLADYWQAKKRWKWETPSILLLVAIAVCAVGATTEAYVRSHDGKVVFIALGLVAVTVASYLKLHTKFQTAIRSRMLYGVRSGFGIITEIVTKFWTAAGSRVGPGVDAANHFAVVAKGTYDVLSAVLSFRDLWEDWLLFRPEGLDRSGVLQMARKGSSGGPLVAVNGEQNGSKPNPASTPSVLPIGGGTSSDVRYTLVRCISRFSHDTPLS